MNLVTNSMQTIRRLTFRVPINLDQRDPARFPE